ncbi:MAG TPA: hypothetical protein VGG06_17680 [Thermoanaerobaculia bacterium]|jgi:hypothetical protein
MFRPIEPTAPRIPALALLALACCWPHFAVPAAAAPFGVPDEVAEELVADLEERYEVITLSRGYALRPLASSEIELIEIEEGRVLVDGEPRDLEGLRELLGDDAEIVFALSGAAEDLAGPAELRRRLAEQQRAAARQLEESIRAQVEELQRLDRDRVDELGDVLERGRRRSRQRVHAEARVAVGSSLTIKEDESARDVVVVLGPLDVRGEVRGDTVVVLGSVEITGELGGALTVVGGNVSLGPDAVVDGEVTCVGGTIHRSPEARVGGEITEVSFAPFSFDFPGIDFEAWSPFRGWAYDRRGLRWLEFLGTVGNTVILAVLTLLAVLIARRRVASVADRARLEPWKAGLIGFVVEVLVLPVLALVSLLLVISIVGIPILFVLWPLSILLLVALFVLGYAGVAVALGQSTVRGRLDPRQASPFVLVLVGLLLVQVWSVFGHGLAVAGGFVRAAGLLLIALGFLLKYLVWTVGLGAVMLDRFSPLPAPAAPPILPDLPDEETDGDTGLQHEGGQSWR